MITCQHEWVEQCKIRYRCETPTGYHFENAHYPLSKKLGGTSMVPLWYPDHIVQGVLQTLEYQYPCIDARAHKKERKILEVVYPEYLGLYAEAYTISKQYAGKKCLEKRIKSDPDYQSKVGHKGAIASMNKNVGVNTPEARQKGGRKAGRIAVESGQLAKARTPESIRKGAIAGANTKWMDPDHPEIGIHNAGVLARKQRGLGLPSGKTNRVKVG